jgi:hypothetical protein
VRPLGPISASPGPSNRNRRRTQAEPPTATSFLTCRSIYKFRALISYTHTHSRKTYLQPAPLQATDQVRRQSTSEHLRSQNTAGGRTSPPPSAQKYTLIAALQHGSSAFKTCKNLIYVRCAGVPPLLIFLLRQSPQREIMPRRSHIRDLGAQRRGYTKDGMHICGHFKHPTAQEVAVGGSGFVVCHGSASLCVSTAADSLCHRKRSNGALVCGVINLRVEITVVQRDVCPGNGVGALVVVVVDHVNV